MEEERSTTIRWVLAGVLTLVVALGAMGSAVGWWTHQILFDTDKWVETVGPIGNDPVVQEALASVVSTELIDLIRPGSRLVAILPDVLGPIGELLGAGIEELIREETAEFFASEAYEDFWIGLNTTVHSTAVAIIRDEVPNVSTAGGVVAVDLEPFLAPIVDRVAAKARELGESLPAVLLTQFDVVEAIDEMVSQYEEEGFPEHLNNVVVYESSRLAAVQTTVAVFDRFVVILPIVTLMVAVLALAIAPNRSRMLLILLLAAIVAWIGALLTTNWITTSLVSAIERDEIGVVAESILTGMTAGLENLLTLVIIVAVVAGAVAVLVPFVQKRRADESE
jgi:hypothetical protein